MHDANARQSSLIDEWKCGIHWWMIMHDNDQWHTQMHDSVDQCMTQMHDNRHPLIHEIVSFIDGWKCVIIDPWQCTTMLNERRKCTTNANKASLCKIIVLPLDSKWQRGVGCLIFIGHSSQNSPMISGSFAERDPQLKAFYAFAPLCRSLLRAYSWYMTLSIRCRRHVGSMSVFVMFLSEKIDVFWGLFCKRVGQSIEPLNCCHAFQWTAADILIKTCYTQSPIYACAHNRVCS